MTATSKPQRTTFGAKTQTLLGERQGDRALRLSDLIEILPTAVLNVMKRAGYPSGGAAPPDGDYGDITVAGPVWTVKNGVITLDDLADVILNAPAAGQSIRFNGTEFVNSFIGLRVPLATRTAAGSTSLDFTEFDNTIFRSYDWDVENLIPSTDDVALLFRTSTNGGATWDSGASDYQWSLRGMNGTVALDAGSGAAGSIVLTANAAGSRVGNAAGEYGVSGLVNMRNAGKTTVPTDVQSRLNYFNTATAYSSYVGSGVRVAAADVDGARFIFNGSNAATGSIRMFGLV